MNQVFGYVSEPKTNFKPFHSRLKLTGPSSEWIAGSDRTARTPDSKGFQPTQLWDMSVGGRLINGKIDRDSLFNEVEVSDIAFQIGRSF
jgi:hypothetical protein